MILLFVGETYYPHGGAEDLRAIEHDISHLELPPADEADWAHAYDTNKRQFVKRWESDRWNLQPTGWTEEPSE